MYGTTTTTTWVCSVSVRVAAPKPKAFIVFYSVHECIVEHIWDFFVASRRPHAHRSNLVPPPPPLYRLHSSRLPTTFSHPIVSTATHNNIYIALVLPLSLSPSLISILFTNNSTHIVLTFISIFALFSFQSRASLVSSSDGGILAEGETSTSETSGDSTSPPCDLGLFERLLLTHPVWFLPGIQRAGAVHLLQGKEEGVSIVLFVWNEKQNSIADQKTSFHLDLGQIMHVESDVRKCHQLWSRLESE